MKHTDGSECKEGTTNVPDNYKPCCDSMKFHIQSCSSDLRIEYLDLNDNGIDMWGIPLDSLAGGGYILINFCPWCGAKLK